MGSVEPTGGREARELLADRAWLVERYDVDGLTQREIAHVLGVSEHKVLRAFVHHRIPRRTPAQRRAHEALAAPPAPVALLCEDYTQRGMSVRQIADKHGLSWKAVRKSLAEQGVSVSATRVRPASVRYPELRDTEWLTVQFVQRGRSLTSVASELGCSLSTVHEAVQRAGIRQR